MSAAPNTPRKGHVQIRDVSVRFGTKGQTTEAASRVSLEVKPGEFVSIIGPSGCGKSTLLNIVAGFLKPSEGEALLDGKPIGGPGADRGVVFQQYSLFPWMTVRRNVEFGLKMQGLGRTQRESAARTLLGMTGLLSFENHYPDQLSGGMKQRVGIVRALATSPQVMLMDEPFGALDSQTRAVMQEILTNMWQQLQLSVLFITHDIEEAIFLSEKVYVMTARPGRIKAEVPIPLPRPRTPEMTASPTFQALVRQLKALIREESLAAMGGELHSGGLQGMDHQFARDGMKALT
ncbi:sulfonate ABC transporter ATP-binding protein [Variovorax sp. Root318D1]|uniref:ABC transporter ATP-binding protein n=1 Tax=Variovorax sp. Root318D1 TaxID=1736513 RepID=UPI0006FEF8B4|nr:ABC transporter ATP-binding protein [Variovorax sp. Root318D1]KQU89743.1 sulfonate ABC transporter ATP-binding protein [Variovorax sp. Root318D1]